MAAYLEKLPVRIMIGVGEHLTCTPVGSGRLPTGCNEADLSGFSG